MFNNPPATNGLIKEALYVKMNEQSTRLDRLQVSNTIYSVIEDSTLLIMDAVNLEEDTARNMKIIDFFSACTSTICFILGAFQLIMTLSANIKDSMWELGVLRSMGCTRGQITRVMIYELISNTLSAMTLGYTSGIIVSCLAIAQFYVTAELPLIINLPYSTLVVVGFCAILSLILGAKFGTHALFSRNIASILKGN